MKKDDYKISVVIPIYNVEKYLEEAIKSIINQTIGFQNIQLILVNDGSPQNESKICNKYKSKYPNIIYIEQENQGVSTARNNGIEYATGKYINFIDPDDKLDLNAFEIGYKLLEENKDINFVAYRQKFFEASKKYHAIDYKFKNKDYIVDITKDYNCIQLSAASSLIRRNAIKNIRFDKKLKISEDAKFMTDILFKNKEKKYALVSSANYLYRKRRVRNSKIQTSALDISNYTFTSKNVYDYVFQLSKKEYGKVIEYAQYFVMYHLQYKLKTPISANLNEKEKEEHNNLLKNLLNQIEDKIILEQQTTTIEDKIHTLNIKYKKDIQNHIKIKNNKVLFKNLLIDYVENEKINIVNIQKNKNNYTITFSAKNYLINHLLIKINNEKIKISTHKKNYYNYEQFKEYSPKEQLFSIEVEKNTKSKIEIYVNNTLLEISGEGKLQSFKSEYSQYKIDQYYLCKNLKELTFQKRNFKTFTNIIKTNINLLITNPNSFLLNSIFYIGKILYNNKNIIYISDENEKIILDYFKKNKTNIKDFIIIRNNKFTRSLKFKLTYLNAKNIYFYYNDVITTPFGHSYKNYINKITTNHIILITKKTTRSDIEKYENSYRNTEFITIKNSEN